MSSMFMGEQWRNGDLGWPRPVTGLLAAARARKLAPAVETMLWYYAKGKPKEQFEHAGGITISWDE